MYAGYFSLYIIKGNLVAFNVAFFLIQVMKNFSTTTCLNCRQSFGSLSIKTGNYLVCSHCGTRYPLLGGKIPVFFKHACERLGAFYWSYEQFFRDQAALQKKLGQLVTREPKRSKILHGISDAVAFNNDYLRSIQFTLREFITVEDILKGIEHNYAAGYSKVLHYLRRDWSGLPEAEEEVAVVINYIHGQLAQHVVDRSSVYVTGAGMGRIVFELRNLFEMVFAIDDSPTMVCSFYNLFDRDIDFYQINAKKVFRDEDTAIRLTASLNRGDVTSVPAMDNLAYFLGDALEAPLADASQSAVISVYFTDVFPLDVYLKEVKRVLKPGGVFIHFGPLEYHFSDMGYMLTANEVMQAFQNEGFTILHQDTIENGHLQASETMTRNVYRNWVFTVRKAVYSVQPLSLGGACIAIAEGVTFDMLGHLSDGEEKIDSIVLSKAGSGERIQITRAIFEFLKSVDGQQTMDAAIDTFSAHHGLSSALHDQLFHTMFSLYQKGIFVDKNLNR